MFSRILQFVVHYRFLSNFQVRKDSVVMWENTVVVFSHFAALLCFCLNVFREISCMYMSTIHPSIDHTHNNLMFLRFKVTSRASDCSTLSSLKERVHSRLSSRASCGERQRGDVCDHPTAASAVVGLGGGHSFLLRRTQDPRGLRAHRRWPWRRCVHCFRDRWRCQTGYATRQGENPRRRGTHTQLANCN